MHLDNNAVRLHKAFHETPPSASTEGLANEASRRQQGHRITAVLVDGTPLTRECLSMSLNSCDRGLHVVPVSTAEEAEALLRGTAPPQVVLYNIAGTTLSEPQVRDLTAMLGPVPLIVFTDHEDIEMVLDAFRLGVRGYIATSLGLSVALEAIRLVAAGGTFVPAGSLSTLMQGKPPSVRHSHGTEDEDAPGGPNELTPRQVAVLNCLREGKANKIIAHELGMCESTVKVHVRNILKKLGATNRTQAVYLTNHRHP